MAKKRMPNCFDALRAFLHQKQSVETVVTLKLVLRAQALIVCIGLDHLFIVEGTSWQQRNRTS
jgi:hypothetical protein